MNVPEIEPAELITDIEASFEVFAEADPRDLFDKAVSLEMRAAFDVSKESKVTDGIHVVEVSTEVRIGRQGQRIENREDDEHYDWDQPYDLVLTHTSRYSSGEDDEEPGSDTPKVKAIAQFESNKTKDGGGLRIVKGEISSDGGAPVLRIDVDYDVDGVAEGPEYDNHELDMLRDARNTMNQLVGDGIDK